MHRSYERLSRVEVPVAAGAQKHAARHMLGPERHGSAGDEARDAGTARARSEREAERPGADDGSLRLNLHHGNVSSTAPMPRLIAAPTVIAAAGTKPKQIEEFAGRVNSGHAGVSVAKMMSPSGWVEPGSAARVRGDHGRAERHGPRRARRRRPRRAAPARRWSPRRANGSATARPTPTAPSTSRSACRRSRRRRCIGTSNRNAELASPQSSRCPRILRSPRSNP